MLERRKEDALKEKKRNRLLNKAVNYR